MRAWRVRELGRADLVDDAPEPLASGPAELVVDVVAAAPNFADTLMIAGTYQERPPLPFTPGLEVLGTITDGERRGERVVGLTIPGDGAWADRARCDARQVVTVPADVDDTSAIALHVNAQTAWFALHRRAGVRPGDRVLVHAAAGGVGSMAVQLAVAAGCTVLATASGAKCDAAVRLGAAACFDRADPGWPAAVRDTVGAVDVVIDPAGGDVFRESVRLLAFEGRLVTVGFASGDIPSMQANHALVKNVALLGLYWSRYTIEDTAAVRAAAAEIWDLHRRGRLAPEVTVRASIEEAPERAADVAAGRTTGKTVLAWGA